MGSPPPHGDLPAEFQSLPPDYASWPAEQQSEWNERRAQFLRRQAELDERRENAGAAEPSQAAKPRELSAVSGAAQQVEEVVKEPVVKPEVSNTLSTKGDAKQVSIDPASRPITFAFNGGPGSSSVWLHLGALGPKRVVMDKEGLPLPPPYALVENEYCWLDMTDLVFIDPVSTGYSRPVDGEAAKQFHGLDEDISWVGEFIRLYTTKNQRWASPKFLAGESYGTTRAAGLSGFLQDTYGMYLNGVVLISAVLNFQTIRSAPGNDLPYPMFLPTFTATAWYHKKLAPDLQADLGKAVAESRDWAVNSYFTVLARGNSLSDAEKDAAVKKLARLTGLSETYIAGSNLRIAEFGFMKELLRDQSATVGRLDSRFKGSDSNNIGVSPDFDPSMAAITGPYTATLYDYVRRELNYQNDKVYEILTGRVQPWSYARANNQYANVADTLRGAMVKNRALRVFVACGYYDLATPMLGAEYTMSHLGVPRALETNITTKYYEAGHMMYIRIEDLAKLTRDVREFYAGAVGGK
ncbi:MAG: peptidase S10 [Pyrinomonadaceae bacterium]|nr:peptidase S10 [Phycisphaerales bacterium]